MSVPEKGLTSSNTLILLLGQIGPKFFENRDVVLILEKTVIQLKKTNEKKTHTKQFLIRPIQGKI